MAEIDVVVVEGVHIAFDAFLHIVYHPRQPRIDSRPRHPQLQPRYLLLEDSCRIRVKSEMDLNYAKWDKVVEEVSQGCFCYLQIVLITLGRHVSLPRSIVQGGPRIFTLQSPEDRHQLG